MELLGVGPGEILLILVIMLLVFGPERLPEFARQAGRFVVRVRDWIQRSPDAALVLRARAELESELQAIRAELTREVESVRQDLQSVRSDLADAGKLVEQSAQDAAAVSKIELPDATAQPAGMPSIAPPAPEANAHAPAPPVQEPASTALPEFDVDPGPIGARIEPPVQPARVVTDDSPLAADMARIDDLSRQVASIAEELARLRVIVLQRMAEEKRRQTHIDPVLPGETDALNRVRDAETLHNGAVSSEHDQALPDNTPAPPRGVEALP